MTKGWEGMGNASLLLFPPEWARSIRAQCGKSGTAFFFKQWGAHNEQGERVGKGVADRNLDGRTWDEMPRFQEA